MTLTKKLMQRYTSTNILAFDIGIRDVACAEFNLVDDIYRLVNVYEIHTIQADDALRYAEIYSFVKGILFGRDSKTYAVIEKPPETLYNVKNASKNVVVGRATKLFKVFSVYGILFSLCLQHGLETSSVQPQQWQKNPRGVNVKKWSVDKANTFIGQQKKKFKHLKQTQHHIADAINIGLHYINHNVILGGTA